MRLFAALVLVGQLFSALATPTRVIPRDEAVKKPAPPGFIPIGTHVPVPHRSVCMWDYNIYYDQWTLFIAGGAKYGSCEEFRKKLTLEVLTAFHCSYQEGLTLRMTFRTPILTSAGNIMIHVDEWSNNELHVNCHYGNELDANEAWEGIPF